MLKNVNDVLKELQKDKSEEAYRQRVIIAAAATCSRYGDPGLAETRRVMEVAKIVKQKLLTGAQTNLKLPEHKKKEVFPEEIHLLATDCWTKKATIVEPAKYKRPAAAPNDGQEVLPARLQIMTDDEAYEQFVEHYKDKVHQIMKERSNRIRQKYKTDTEYNKKMQQTLIRHED